MIYFNFGGYFIVIFYIDSQSRLRLKWKVFFCLFVCLFVCLFRCSNDVTVKYLSAPSFNVQRFSLEAFKFIADHPFVFVHCHVIVCNATDPGSKCAKSCSSSGRGRREVAAHTNDVYSLVQGPLYLARKKRGERHEIGLDKSGMYSVIQLNLYLVSALYLTYTTSVIYCKCKQQ